MDRHAIQTRDRRTPVNPALDARRLRVVDHMGQVGTVLGSINHGTQVEVEYDNVYQDCWGNKRYIQSLRPDLLTLWDDATAAPAAPAQDHADGTPNEGHELRLAVTELTWCEQHGCAESECGI